MKLPWLFIKSSPKNAKERETGGMELVSMRQDVAYSYGFIGRMLTPLLYMQFPNRRFVVR